MLAAAFAFAPLLHWVRRRREADPRWSLRESHPYMFARLRNFVQQEVAGSEARGEDKSHNRGMVLGALHLLKELCVGRFEIELDTLDEIKETDDAAELKGLQVPLFEAVRRNDVGTIRRIMETCEGTGIAGIKDESGDKALHVAAQEGHLDAIRALCVPQYLGTAVTPVGGPSQLWQLEDTGFDSYAPLHWAAERGHLEAVKLLPDDALLHGCRDCNFDLCSFCYNAEQADTQPIKGIAAQLRNDEGRAVRLGDEEFRTFYCNVVTVRVTNTNCTMRRLLALFMTAASAASSDIAVLSPEQRAKLADELAYAVMMNQQATIERLLVVGVSPDGSENAETGQHALHFCRNARLLQLLLGAGARTELRDKRGWTALHVACSESRHDHVRLLLSHGADTSADSVREPASQKGWTPLHFAADAGAAECVGALLAAGASAEKTDSSGHTALDFAGAQQHQGVVAMLREHSRLRRDAAAGAGGAGGAAARPARPASGQHEPTLDELQAAADKVAVCFSPDRADAIYRDGLEKTATEFFLSGVLTLLDVLALEHLCLAQGRHTALKERVLMRYTTQYGRSLSLTLGSVLKRLLAAGASRVATSAPAEKEMMLFCAEEEKGGDGGSRFVEGEVYRHRLRLVRRARGDTGQWIMPVVREGRWMHPDAWIGEQPGPNALLIPPVARALGARHGV
eukprot:g3822.t1